MNSRSHKQGSTVIVYDADRIQQPGPDLFDPEQWRQKGAVFGQAKGRGSALLLDTPFGQAVLRQCLRGGWPARISRDSYLFIGYRRSRPILEFNMLAELAARGLPVPGPLAAVCERSGLFYRGWLMTRLIPHSVPLGDHLAERANDAGLWRRVGCVIHRFHDAGVVHADLNARNILLGPGDDIHLVDFDRARFSAGNDRAFSRNLSRLKRSLEKLWPTPERSKLDRCWQELLKGYGAGAETT